MLASAISMVRSKAGFVQQFIRNPRKVGSITPSSMALCESMASCVDWSQVKHIAELGAGDGVLTRVLLNHMSAATTMDVFEISPPLVSKLRMINDPRVVVHATSAECLDDKYDAIFSGLPLLSLPVPVRHAILSAVHRSLTPGGVFVQFQYTSLTQSELSRYFTWERQRVLKNVPPAWVYRCTEHWAAHNK
ncbi:class I SAM-dependent methyltransferase [Tatumella saanichensis]|uniref:class I SAM-dependent methyltransferase n=1 Tax=Tatumella saanichensis TaxID=480813 RepID=UPI0004A35232|nr:methyltransferase domain-containing protein [Tatumella saanichensis]